MINYNIESVLSSDAHWNINKKLVSKIGFVTSGVLMELIFCRRKFKQKEFYTQVEYIEEILCIGKDMRQSCFKKLISLNLITIVKKGIPARNFYTINDEELLRLLGVLEENSLTSTSEKPLTVNPKPAHCATEKPHTYSKKVNKEVKSKKSSSNGTTTPNPDYQKVEETFKVSAEKYSKPLRKGFSKNIDKMDPFLKKHGTNTILKMIDYYLKNPGDNPKLDHPQPSVDTFVQYFPEIFKECITKHAGQYSEDAFTFNNLR